MQRVLYIISTLKKTGPVNVLYNIIKNLDRTKYEPVILTLSKEPEGSIKHEFEALNIECYCLNLKGVKGYSEARKIKDVVKNIAPDIIHTHCFRSTLFTALYLNKYKTISTIHCDYDTYFPAYYGKLIGNIMTFLMNFSLSQIQLRICVSGLLCDILNKRKRIKFSFVNNGVDIERFKPISDKSDLRKKLGLPLDKKLFIWVGNLIEGKNPLLLVKAIKKIMNDDFFFIFCGDGNLYSEIKEQIKNLSNVILTGNVDNIDEYLQASDYYMSTSLSEGLPMSVLEAMSCGLPVLLSDIEQHKYVLKDDKAGIVFKVNDEKDLMKKIKYILNSDYSEMSIKAREVVLDNFSSLKMAENYQKKYEELVK